MARNARFYSTTLGRFVSADPVADGLNRYAYVHDNPLRYTDPTGETCAPAMKGLGGLGDPGDCPAGTPDEGNNDAGAPCGSLCVAWKQLDAAGIHSQADLERYQYQQALVYCYANPGDCGGGSQTGPAPSPLPTGETCSPNCDRHSSNGGSCGWCHGVRHVAGKAVHGVASAGNAAVHRVASAAARVDTIECATATLGAIAIVGEIAACLAPELSGMASRVPSTR